MAESSGNKIEPASDTQELSENSAYTAFSASVSSQLPEPLSTSLHTVVGLPGQSNTDNDQGHVDSRPTSSMGRTEHGTEQVCGKT